MKKLKLSFLSPLNGHYKNNFTKKLRALLINIKDLAQRKLY